MKKEHLILISLILILFIQGCTGSITSLGSGPNGVQIKFIQPDNVIATKGIDEGSTLPIVIELTNNGECAVNGKLCIRDTLSDSYGGIADQCKDVVLNEARLNNKKLELDKQKFIFQSQPYSNLFKTQETNLQATVKYNCDILMGPSRLCIKSQLDQDETKCKNFETISGSSLGMKVAPITIKSIEKQSYLENSNQMKLKTDITLTKMSKGKISYSNDEFKLQGNPLEIEVDYAGNLMTCKGRDFKDGILSWKSTDTEKIINCEILLNSGDLQENPLNIHLNYDYEITESKLIKINHIES